MIQGVDLSSYQGPPGQWRSEAGDIAFGAVKMTEYSAGAKRYENPTAPADWAALKLAGHGRIAYLFGHPAAPMQMSVDYFLSVLDVFGLDDGDTVALDHEVSDGLPPGAVSDWALTALERLESRTSRRPLLYTFRAFADEGNCHGLGGYPLWIADPSSPAGHPSVPAPWTAWAIHQHTITAPIDRDVADYPDLPTMRAALGRKEPAVTIEQWRADGHTSLAQLAGERHTGPSTVLRHTAAHGLFSAPVAHWLDAVFSGALPPSAPIPAGAVLWVPVG